MMTEDDLSYCGRKIHEMNVAVSAAESDLYALRKTIADKQAEHKQIIEDLKKEQRSELGELQRAYGRAKHAVDKMKWELGQMKKHRSQLRMLKKWLHVQHKSVDEQEGTEQ